MSDWGPTVGERLMAQAARDEKRRRAMGGVLFGMAAVALALVIFALALHLLEKLA